MAMIAARLDHKMLVNHDPSTFLKLVAPGNRTFLSNQFRTGHLLTLVTLIDDGARLDSHPPRVSGRTSFASTRDESGLTVLAIVTNYVWAYGFDNDKVVLVHDEVRWQSYRVGDVRDSDLGLWPDKYEGYFHNVNCAAADRGLLAPPRPSDMSIDTTPDSEDPRNYYDPDHALQVTDTCGHPTSAAATAT
jgi:hypothetical protein